MRVIKSVLTSLLLLTCALLPELAWAQTGQIAGTVTDSLSGEPIPGVNVVIEGTTTGAATDGDGSYEIPGLEPGSYDVQASFVGYGTRLYQDVAVTAGETTTLDARLIPGALQLDEVVAVAYGTTRRQAVTGSVANVEMEALASRPLSSVDEALEGQIPGVIVQNRSGIPGGGPKIQVRGTGNVGAGGEPLYVVDGFALPQAGEGSISRQNPLAEIPPEDIESITVLKDASATAIYGSRASNGVVIVTTKQGEAGQFAFNVNASTGWNTPWQRDIPDPATARQFVEFQNFIWADRVAQGAADEIPAEYRDPSAYGDGTNWWNEIINTSRRHEVHVSASGGTSNLRSYFSLGYTRDEGLMVSHDFNRISARANVDAAPSERLSLGLNLAPSYTQQDLNFSGTNRGTGGGAPWRLCPIESADEPQPGINCTGVWNDANPVMWLEEVEDNSRILRTIASAYANYEPIDGLTARSQFNVDFRNENSNRFDPSSVGGINRPPPDVPSGGIGTNRYLNWLSETTFNWDAVDLGPGALDLLGGFTIQQQIDDGSGFSGVFPGDAIRTFNVASQIQGGSNEEEWSLVSFLGRLNYNLYDKYIFTGTVRTDGSSRFGADNRWGTFPSAAVAWNIHNEPFMANTPNVQQLRLRASYGETGNNQIGNYASLGVVTDVEYVLGGAPAPGRVLATMGNPTLSWEKTQEFNLGVDAVLYNNVDLAVDVYQRNTTQLLINRELPDVAGFGSVTENTGELRNRGIEVGLTTVNVNRDNFRWNSTISFALNQNEIVSLPGGNDIRYTPWPAEYLHREGLPMASYVGFIVDGVYTSEEQINNTAHFTGAVPGTMVWRDLNGDGVLTEDVMAPGGDYAVLGDAFPDFTFSFQNAVSVGRFDFSALLSGEFGGTNLRTEWITTPRNIDGLFNVDADYVKNFWRSPQQPGDGLTPTPIGGAAPRQQYRDTQHTMFLWDATYIALRSLTVRYNLGGRFQGTSVYAAGSNLFVISPYPSNPQATDLNDASNAPGRDDGNYPIPRRFTFGVSLSF